MINSKAIERKNNFFNQLELSPTTIKNYRSALKSSYLIEILKKECGVSDIFEIDDINLLWSLYSKINLSPKNLGNHRSFSAPIMKYIRFLNNGKKIGRRIDFNKPRVKRR